MTAVKLEDARRVISAAEKKASEIGQPMNIAVADEGGNIVAHIRMDNGWIGSIDIALKKAYTSRAFEIETKDLAKHCSIRRPVLRCSCVKRWQDHDLRWWHPVETRWQGSRGDRRQRWFRRSGSCRGRGRCRRVLTAPDRADLQEETNPCRIIIPVLILGFPTGTPDWTSPICMPFRSLGTPVSPS